ncbi:MAG TPA: hypothetical protein DDW36_03820 [Candidatus Magasanikbacteria bacterium]|nr:hypothetical protein [Candidatus Magasanikbacteria bacterium]
MLAVRLGRGELLHDLELVGVAQVGPQLAGHLLQAARDVQDADVGGAGGPEGRGERIGRGAPFGAGGLFAGLLRGPLALRRNAAEDGQGLGLGHLARLVAGLYGRGLGRDLRAPGALLLGPRDAGGVLRGQGGGGGGAGGGGRHGRLLPPVIPWGLDWVP